MASQSQSGSWLVQYGPHELELLFRAIVFHPSAPILLTDDDRRYREASAGAARLLGLPREKIIGRSLDDFAEPGFKRAISERWSAFLKEGQQEGTLQITGPDGTPREVEYIAKGNVLPVRHLLVLRDKTLDKTGADTVDLPPLSSVPGWVKDYALFLLDPDGQVVAWYAGAQRIYGYDRSEIVGQHVSLFYPDEDAPRNVREKLKRAAAEGHAGGEGWHVKKDGSRFWASVITMALKDENGALQGFARVVRDFSERHERDEKVRRSRARLRPRPVESSIAGIVSGEFDRIPEANDAFLEMVGYESARRSWCPVSSAQLASPGPDTAGILCSRRGRP